MTRILGAIAALAISVSGLAAVPTLSASAASPHHHPGGHHHGRPAPSYTPPPLQWGECKDADLQTVGAECADLVVPLSYRHPRGKKITVAVSRVVHSSSDARYQGRCWSTPAGPAARA